VTLTRLLPAGVFLLVLHPLAGCALPAGAQAKPSPTAPVTALKGYPLADLRILDPQGGDHLDLVVELPNTNAAMSDGLMNVRHLSDGYGMLFDLGHSSRTAFWMKDTLIPLDIAFWDDLGQIVDIQQMKPCAADPCTQYRPSAFYTSALEVNLGLFERHGVRVGDQVKLTQR
jgi:hypothetical protein